MKPKLILISHGHFAEELRRSAEMITGPINDLYTVAMLESDGLDGTEKKLHAVLDKLDGAGDIVIIADIVSGTPCNVAVHAMYQKQNVSVITGLNLAMVLEYTAVDTDSGAEMAEELCSAGKVMIKHVQKTEASGGEEGYED